MSAIEDFQDFKTRLMRIESDRQRLLEAVANLREEGDHVWLEIHLTEALLELMGHE
jgi:chromosome segregation ATPase